jgi:hypothetical protein
MVPKPLDRIATASQYRATAGEFRQVRSEGEDQKTRTKDLLATESVDELAAGASRGGNAGLMESAGDSMLKLSCLPLFPQTLEIARERRFLLRVARFPQFY